MAYLLFAGNDYYPLGGAEDLKGKYADIQSAIIAHNPTEYTYDGGWANVLCLDTLKVVMCFSRGVWSERRLK